MYHCTNNHILHYGILFILSSLTSLSYANNKKSGDQEMD